MSEEVDGSTRRTADGAFSCLHGTQFVSIDFNVFQVCGFVQLYVLSDANGEKSISGERNWNEISRWVKYEQDLEEGRFTQALSH